MKLSSYMELKHISDPELAKRLNRDRTLVSRYRRGECRPPLEIIKRIKTITNNAVSYEDFL